MIHIVTIIEAYPNKSILDDLKKSGNYNEDLPAFMQQGYRRSRTWGYFLSKTRAFDSVLQNNSDIWEAGSFDYAFGVIEKFSEGLFTLADEEGWFFAKSIKINGGFKVDVQIIEKPKWSKGTINWGMG